jgi:hypothetical protein
VGFPREETTMWDFCVCVLGDQLGKVEAIVLDFEEWRRPGEILNV